MSIRGITASQRAASAKRASKPAPESAPAPKRSWKRSSPAPSATPNRFFIKMPSGSRSSPTSALPTTATSSISWKLSMTSGGDREAEMETAAGKIVLVGAGGHASEVRAYILDLLCRGWQGRLLGFLDDNVPKGPHRGLEIIGTL